MFHTNNVGFHRTILHAAHFLLSVKISYPNVFFFTLLNVLIIVYSDFITIFKLRDRLSEQDFKLAEANLPPLNR